MGTHVPIKSGDFDETVGKENLPPGGWMCKWDVRWSAGSHFTTMRREPS